MLSQLNATVIGDAIDLGDNCYIITPDLEFQTGGVWYDNPIDFDSDFSIYYQNNFGNKDANGADGMALVIKNNPTPILGGSGGGLGYSGISNSLIIEFDTYISTDLGDPSADHIAILRDGNPNHNSSATNLAGPIEASATSANIEDGVSHEVRIEWNANTNLLSVFFDCQLRLILNEDVKNTIFSGDDSVYFGFVGSTGGLTNLHQVCFNRISFVDNLQIDDETICENGSVQVDATIPSGVTYSWTPTTGVSDPDIPDPFLSPATTTTYTVTIGDICGETVSEELTVTVEPLNTDEPIFDPVPPICVGDPLDDLPTTSNNGIIGNWTPALDNTMTTTYTFTPLPSECNIGTTLTIEVVAGDLPIFDPVPPACAGAFIAPLPTTSNNGFTGSWAPAINNMATTTYTFTPLPGQCAAVTTLVIEILPPDIPVFDPVEPVCVGGDISELPTTSNNGITGMWSPEINNTMTTIYTFTPDEGQGCAVETTLEIIITTPITPTFDPVAPVCIGDVIDPLPIISNEGILGSWSPALNNLETTTYTFSPEPEQCANSNATIEIQIIPLNELSISFEFENDPFDFLQHATITIAGGSGPYEYQIGNADWVENNIIRDIQGCQEITVRAREIYGCSTEAEATFKTFHYPYYFTPNGDGIHDTWNIECIREQQDAFIIIYNRLGKMLTTIRPSNTGWDGTYNGKALPSSDYWFKVQYKNQDGTPRVYRSHFTLKR